MKTNIGDPMMKEILMPINILRNRRKIFLVVQHPPEKTKMPDLGLLNYPPVMFTTSTLN